MYDAKTSDADFVGNILIDKLGNTFTAIVGSVTSYDASSGRADILPLVARSRLADRETGRREAVPMNILTDVPIIIPGCRGSQASVILQEGDVGLILVHDFSLDEIVDTDVGTAGSFDTTIQPEDPRTRDLNDAFFLPFTINTGVSLPSADRAIHGDAIRIGEAGEAYEALLTAGSGGTLASKINEIITALAAVLPPPAIPAPILPGDLTETTHLKAN